MFSAIGCEATTCKVKNPANPDLGRSPRLDLELVAEEELASLLKICKRQLYNMRMRGEIPHFKIGRSDQGPSWDRLTHSGW